MKNWRIVAAVILLLGCSDSNGTFSEAIQDPQANQYYSQAQEVSKKGVEGWQQAIDLYDRANELEPENPIILHARAQIKILSGIDIEGGFIDHEAAINFSTDSINLQMRYSNRALDYLKIKDICAACSDWEKAGDSQNYLDKYCQRNFSNEFAENVNDNVALFLSLLDTSAAKKIKQGGLNSSACLGQLAIVNNSNPEITIVDDLLDFGHEVGSESTLFLQAKGEDGAKVHFFNDRTYQAFSPNEDVKLLPEFVYQKELNILEHHYFPYSGKYWVRVGIRPSQYIIGLAQTYYSNWVEIEVLEN